VQQDRTPIADRLRRRQVECPPIEQGTDATLAVWLWVLQQLDRVVVDSLHCPVERLNGKFQPWREYINARPGAECAEIHVQGAAAQGTGL